MNGFGSCSSFLPLLRKSKQPPSLTGPRGSLASLFFKQCVNVSMIHEVTVQELSINKIIAGVSDLENKG